MPIRRCRHVEQSVAVKQRQQQINDSVVLATVGQPMNLIQRLALSQRLQLLSHAGCITNTVAAIL